MNTREILEPLFDNVIWLQITGIFFLIIGIITCLTIVGLIYGWIPVWLGVLLIQAASLLKDIDGEDSGEDFEYDAFEVVRKISRYFKIQGILVIVYLGLIVLLLSFAGLSELFSN